MNYSRGPSIAFIIAKHVQWLFFGGDVFTVALVEQHFSNPDILVSPVPDEAPVVIRCWTEQRVSTGNEMHPNGPLWT